MVFRNSSEWCVKCLRILISKFFVTMLIAQTHAAGLTTSECADAIAGLPRQTKMDVIL